ncbi:hypothetical protein BDW62DRAFT_189452 [Aspergillus aurantiobrunneus]
MAAAGARAQKPVGSAAWISTEKENCTQLVDQEMEEIEFPVRYEMEWLNEHMAEVFSSNQFNFTDAFKTPGKLRGKTPRTLRKREPTENRVPLSEIFSSIKKNRTGTKFSPSPAAQRSPTKAITVPTAPTPPAQPKNKATNLPQPQYPDLTQNINSFSQYNTDSGYHGMPDDDDEMVLTQVAPVSQPSTQPFDLEPIAVNGGARRSSADRRTTDASFHSAREEVRHRGETVEPMNIDSPKQSRKEHMQPPETIKEPEPKEDAVMEDQPTSDREALTAPNGQDTDGPGKDVKSSPVKGSAQPPSPQEHREPQKDEMTLDNLDDIGSPSDVDSPERPPIRKSSLSFASLPAREPLGSKTLGGSRLSRTSHLDSIKPNTGASSTYFGRQTGHRMTQALDEKSQADNMDVDESKQIVNEESDVDAKASQLHNKSSTQRLHEKISMLGKMQPSRPTKSIPAVAGLSSAPVSHPELPVAQPETKQEPSNAKQRETTPPRPTADAEDDWIKPLSSPFQAYPSTAKAAASKPKSSEPPTSDAPEGPSSPTKSRVNEEITRTHTRQASENARGKSATPIFSSPQRYGHQKSASVNIDSKMTTTPIGSPSRQDGPLSASKSRLQSIVRSAKGLFTSSGGVSAAARNEASSPDEPKAQLQRAYTDIDRASQRPLSVFSPPRQEGRRTRSSTEREERRRQQEIDERKREEELAEKARQEEKGRATQQQKPTRERARTESEARGPPASATTLPSSPIRAPQAKPSKEPEPSSDAAPKAVAQPSGPQATRLNDRRPTKPTREPQQKPKPQPVSIRVGSALSRQIPLASSVAANAETSIPAPAPTPSASKAPSLKKKASNQSLHAASSNSSFKSSASSQTQRKAQLASERKREQDEREARRKEEQRREMERKRAAQQSRAEGERRERQAEDPKKAAQMQAIEKRRLENARRLERQGSQQPEMGPTHSEKPAQPSQREPGPPRPASRLGSVLGRTINQPAPNPAKPPKRGLEEETNHRPAAAKPGAIQPSGETKRRRTDDEENHASMRPTMAPPIRQSNIRKEPAKKPSMYGAGQHSAAPQPGSSIFKTGQPQRPGHPMDMAKYASGKIPFAEPSNAAGPSQPYRTPGPSSSKPPKPSPNFPNGENINLPEIATDSEDEDSEAEMLPVPNWAQPKQLETLLRDQEGMETDSIFGPIAPFSLEETFKADKKIKKFRERTSSANWAGPDGLTQDEIRKDVAERQRLRLNGGWTFGM